MHPEPLYVFACMMKPGNNYYMVRQDPKKITMIGDEELDMVSSLSHLEPEYFIHQN